MSVDKRITIKIVEKEIQECQEDAGQWNWEISEINVENQSFTVYMKSPIDNEKYIIEIKFDNYKELPLLIEFIDPITGKKGIKSAYPKNKGKYGNIFHGLPCICHPCSRKAYKKDYGGPHSDWAIIGWEKNSRIGTLTNIRAILQAIYFRISYPDIYYGRMQ